MRHQNRYRHLLQHVRRRTPKDEFAYPGVAIGAHHQQVGSEVDGPHLESLTGGQACRWKSFRGRLDAMARESRRKLGTWDGACSLQCLLRVNPRNGDSFGLLQERNRIERCPGRLSCAVPTDEDTATKSFEARRSRDQQEWSPEPHDETFDEIKLDTEAFASVHLAGNDEVRDHAMLDDRDQPPAVSRHGSGTIRMPDQSGAFGSQRSPSLGARAA